jgi:hypothetical protein
MGTLKEDMADDFESIILDEDEFAEKIIHYPGGDTAGGVERVAKVEMHEEAGLAIGSFAPPRDTLTTEGEEIVRYCRLHLPLSVEVLDEERGARRDAFMVRGELYRAVRITGRTTYRQTVFCERRVRITTKRGR